MHPYQVAYCFGGSYTDLINSTSPGSSPAPVGVGAGIEQYANYIN